MVLTAATLALGTRAISGERMTHIALLGDSVIDNKAYVADGPDVAQQLQAIMPKHWKVSRLALDGAVSSDVIHQLERLPADATHLVISAGGNDALAESGILDASTKSVAEALGRLAQIQNNFRNGYARMLDAALGYGPAAAVCTVYDPRFSDPLRRRLGSLALSVINDAITREAFSRNVTVIDLRVMFNDDSDFANPIEPSVHGGMKLARAVLRFASHEPGDTVVLR
jgi:lysophospholipase L1-like esterase